MSDDEDDNEDAFMFACDLIAGTIDDLETDEAIGLLGNELARVLTKEIYPHAADGYQDDEIVTILCDAVDRIQAKRVVH